MQLMKIKFYKPHSLAGMLFAAYLVGNPTIAGAQFISPEGTWDFVIGGSGQQGLAAITFSADNTFVGHEMLVPKSTAVATDSGRGNVDSDREPTEAGTTVTTNLFGYSPISGNWFFNAEGRVIGNYSIQVGSGSNAVVHGISFTGKVVPGKRFTLVASTSTGRLTFRGIPFQQLPDLSSLAYWYGYKTENMQTSIEVFTLSPLEGNVYFMNMSGTGPGYTYVDGICMASAQKRIGFAMMETPTGATEGLLRASIGPFVNTVNKTEARTKGVKEPDTRFKFNATVAPLLP
jgi:hypothetical protein